MGIIKRIVAFISYVTLIGIVLVRVNGGCVWEIDGSNDWVVAAITALLFTLLTAPFFEKVTDSLSSSISAVLILIGLRVSSPIYSSNTFNIFWWIWFCYLILFIVFDIVILVLSKKYAKTNIRFEWAYKITNTLGSGEVSFTGPYFLSAFAFFTGKVELIFIILLLWVVIFFVKPAEIVLKLIKKKKKDEPERIGNVIAYENPNIAIVDMNLTYGLKKGDIVAIIKPNKNIVFGMILWKVSLHDKCWLRIHHGNEVDPKAKKNEEKCDCIDCKTIGQVYGIPKKLEDVVMENKWIPLKSENVLGYVVENSDLNKIQFEIIDNQTGIYEGCLVHVNIRGERTIYQIINALTVSESLTEKSRDGFFRVTARKLGKWNETKKTFDAVKWLPEILTPIERFEMVEYEYNSEFVGQIPGSNYGLPLISQLAVTHNTAILGVLGIGKTYLAKELILRIIADGIKVICLDITGQYILSKILGDIKGAKLGQKRSIEIQKKINELPGELNNGHPDRGGTICGFRDYIKVELKNFIEDSEQLLEIYNPEFFNVEVQPKYQTLMNMTVVEIASIILEELLKLISTELSDEARICVVLEEAHSLVPEWNSVSYEGDKKATIRSAKAILQGRKYGMGAIVITQRTAHVSKSVLNQCNTVFAMRAFDEKSMEFLSNYMGKDYSSLLPSLDDRFAVVYGRGLKAKAPLVIELNDKDDFHEAFFEKHPDLLEQKDIEEIPVEKETNNQETPEEKTPTLEAEDDLPF